MATHQFEALLPGSFLFGLGVSDILQPGAGAPSPRFSGEMRRGRHGIRKQAG